MKPAHCRHRKDDTAAALVEEAVAYGAKVIPINGVIDAILHFRGHVYLVDWKSAKTKLTPNQVALVTQGWPIWFIRDSQALRELLFGRAA